MEIRFVSLELPRIDVLRYEAAALPFFEDERPLQGAAGLCDWRMCGRISRLLRGGRVTGVSGEITLLPVRPRLPFDKLVLFGLGPQAAFERPIFDGAVARILETMSRLRLRTFVMALPGRATGQVAATDAMRWFLSAPARSDFEEVVVLDHADAQRSMLPLVEAERRRVRATADVGG